MWRELVASMLTELVPIWVLVSTSGATATRAKAHVSGRPTRRAHHPTRRNVCIDGSERVPDASVRSALLTFFRHAVAPRSDAECMTNFIDF